MLIFLILIVIIWGVSRWSEKARFWKNKLIQQPFNYYILLGLLVIGFFFRLEYTSRWGCFSLPEPVFEWKNILFSAASITLVLLSFFFKNRTIKLAFVASELLFWLSKLFLFKGGYAVGMALVASTKVSLYDAITLTLRLFIIISLLKTNFNQVFVLICAIFVMYIKIHIFPFPYSHFVEQEKFEQERENTKNFLAKGEWIENKDTTAKIRIILYPENAVIYNLNGKDSLSFNSVSYLTGKYVCLELWNEITYASEHAGIAFQEKGEDTINVNIWYENEEYKTQMIRKPE